MTVFPVYQCEEWQCRFVFKDRRCCGLKIGHVGEHKPAMSEHHFHSERCYAMGPGDTEELICDGKDTPYERAVDPIPTVPAREQRLIVLAEARRALDDGRTDVVRRKIDWLIDAVARDVSGDALRAQLEEARKENASDIVQLVREMKQRVEKAAAAHTALCAALRAVLHEMKMHPSYADGQYWAAQIEDRVLALHGEKE